MGSSPTCSIKNNQMAAQKKKHSDNQLRPLEEFRQLKECESCCKRTARVIETRKVFDGVRRRYSCSSCDHRYTTFEISSNLYDELRNLRNKINKLQQVFSDIAPLQVLEPVSFEPVSTAESIPCCDCAHLTPYGCSFDIPEAQTEDACGCNLFKAIVSDSMLL